MSPEALAHPAATLPTLALSLLDRGPTSSLHLGGELARMAGTDLPPEEIQAVIEALLAGGLASVLMETPRHRYLQILPAGKRWLRQRLSAWEAFRLATLG